MTFASPAQFLDDLLAKVSFLQSSAIEGSSNKRFLYQLQRAAVEINIVVRSDGL
jgi:hypothetical protein